MGRRADAAAASAAVMAQCVQSVQELIPDSFVPCVAALCSDEAERLTRLNHLSFAELLKPFSRLTSEGMCSPLCTELLQSRGREREVGGGRGREGRCLHLGSRESGVGLGRRGVFSGRRRRFRKRDGQDSSVVLTSSFSGTSRKNQTVG